MLITRKWGGPEVALHSVIAPALTMELNILRILCNKIAYHKLNVRFSA